MIRILICNLDDQGSRYQMISLFARVRLHVFTLLRPRIGWIIVRCTLFSTDMYVIPSIPS